MFRIFSLCMEAAVGGIFFLPLLLILNKRYFQNRLQTTFYFLFLLYLAGVWAAVGLPNASYLRFDLNLNLIPFSGILADFTNSILNIALFLPLGFFLPLFWQDYQSIQRALLFGAVLSATIELLQILTFRATDINDLITNTLGTLLGWWLWRLVYDSLPEFSLHGKKKDVLLLLGSVFVVMFFLQPFLFSFLWYTFA